MSNLKLASEVTRMTKDRDGSPCLAAVQALHSWHSFLQQHYLLSPGATLGLGPARERREDVASAGERVGETDSDSEFIS